MHTRAHALDSVTHGVEPAHQRGTGSTTTDQGDQLTVDTLSRNLEDDRIRKISTALVIQRRKVGMHIKEISSKTNMCQAMLYTGRQSMMVGKNVAKSSQC